MDGVTGQMVLGEPLEGLSAAGAGFAVDDEGSRGGRDFVMARDELAERYVAGLGESGDGDFFGFAYIEQGKASSGGAEGGELVGGDGWQTDVGSLASQRVIGQGGECRGVAAQGASWIPAELDFAMAHGKGVDVQQSTDQRAAESGQ